MAKKFRVQFDVVTEFVQKLDNLVELSEASSRAELFRKSINLFEIALHTIRNGGKIIFEDSNGDKKEVILL